MDFSDLQSELSALWDYIWSDLAATSQFKLVLTVITWFTFIKLKGRINLMLKALYDRMGPFVEIEDRQRRVVSRFLDWFIYVVGVALTLFYWGVTSAFYSLLTALAILFFIVGFAALSLLGNVWSGLIIMMERPFVMGDTIHVGEYGGVVKALTLRYVLLETDEGTVVMLPNSELLNHPLTNFSLIPDRRTDITVTIANAGDLPKARKLLGEIAEANTLISDAQPPLVQVVGVADNRYKLRLRCWTPRAALPDLRSTLHQDIAMRFDEANIQLA